MQLSKVTMILRGYTYEQVRCVAEVLLDATYVRNMEVTLNTEGAYDIIRKISEEFGDRLNVGAGTVMTFDELVKAVDAGAKFALSPYKMSKEMLDYCKEHGIYSVPGSFTPSEVAESFANGANCVKIFPANEVSYSYAKKIIEPMGRMALMAVGGVNASNVAEVLTSGYEFAGSAGGIFKKEDIQNLDKEAMRMTLAELENGVKSI